MRLRRCTGARTASLHDTMLSAYAASEMASSNTSSSALAALRGDWLSGERSKGRAYERLLTATERLLASSGLHDVTVADILREAGVSRPTFYSYFSSKFDIAAVLYERVLTEMLGAFMPVYERESDGDVERAFQQAIDQMVAVWTAHRAVLRVAVEQRHTSPELTKQTSRMTSIWVPILADQIDRDRAAGIAPPGGPSRALVISLLWSTETTLYVAGMGLAPDLPDEHAAAEPLLAMWLGSIYGIVPKPRGAGPDGTCA